MIQELLLEGRGSDLLGNYDAIQFLTVLEEVDCALEAIALEIRKCNCSFS